MTTLSPLATSCREAWASGKVEEIAAIAEELRFQQGLDLAQVHQTFVITTGVEIPLADFDLVMQAADDGYTGTLDQLRRGLGR